MKKNIYLLIACLMLSFPFNSAIFAADNKTPNVKTANIGTKTDTNNKDTKIIITPSYQYSSYYVNGISRFPSSIALNTTDKYGKAYFSNKGSKPVTLRVDGQPDKIIQPGASDGVTWTYTGILSRTYQIELSETNIGITGYYSLAKSDKPFVSK